MWKRLALIFIAFVVFLTVAGAPSAATAEETDSKCGPSQTESPKPPHPTKPPKPPADTVIVPPDAPGIDDPCGTTSDTWYYYGESNEQYGIVTQENLRPDGSIEEVWVTYIANPGFVFPKKFETSYHFVLTDEPCPVPEEEEVIPIAVAEEPSAASLASTGVEASPIGVIAVGLLAAGVITVALVRHHRKKAT